MSLVASRVAKKLQAFGQSHVTRYLEELSEAESAALLSQVDALDLNLVRDAHAFATKSDGREEDKISSLPRACIVSPPTASAAALEYKTRGLLEISAGKVCAILLAGGQGTRLGFSGPKGSFQPGLPSRKTLFQLSIERLKKVKALASATTTLPLYILTSEANDLETRAFFAQHHYFGLDQSEIFFFTQGMLPCVTVEGKLMLECKHRLAMSPDGNGGLFSALDKSGALADMQRRGIEYVHVMAIDNPQNLPGDPSFIGACVANAAEAGNLCIPKKHAEERVGVCALRNDKFHVVEYTESAQLGSDAVSNLANICNHFFTLKFLVDKVMPGMKALHHAAFKTIPTVEDANAKGIKLELFIFDAFPFAERYVAYESGRAENFAPIKNAEGEDSPETCRALIYELHKSWLQRAGAILEGEGACEISALVTIDGVGLDRIVSGMRLQLPLYIESGLDGTCVDIDEFGMTWQQQNGGDGSSADLRLQVDYGHDSSDGVTKYRVVRARQQQQRHLDKQDEGLASALAKVSLETTTPMDALFILNDLKRMAAAGAPRE